MKELKDMAAIVNEAVKLICYKEAYNEMGGFTDYYDNLIKKYETLKADIPTELYDLLEPLFQEFEEAMQIV